MEFEPTPLAGACVIRPARHADARGFFARTYCETTFAAQGLHTHWPQCNISFNAQAYTLRGMHWQAAPHEEVKLVRCTAGAIWDAIVDLRPESPTRLQWFAVALSAENRLALYIPAGFAHGFLTLAPETEVFYQMGANYTPEAARGARYNDPAFGIQWPAAPVVISERDAQYPDYADA